MLRSILFRANLMFALLLTGNCAFGGIVNGSFESVLAEPGSFIAASIPGWTGDTSTDYYFGVTREYDLIPNPVDGVQVAFVNNFDDVNGPTQHGISQTISDTLAANTKYTFSAYFGWRDDNQESIGGLELWAGGAASEGGVVGGTLLASKSVRLTQGTFVKGTLTYVASSGSPLLGEHISVRLTGTPITNDFAQTNFDNATFSAEYATPEPATLHAAAMGIIGIGAFLARKRFAV